MGCLELDPHMAAAQHGTAKQHSTYDKAYLGLWLSCLELQHFKG